MCICDCKVNIYIAIGKRNTIYDKASFRAKPRIETTETIIATLNADARRCPIVAAIRRVICIQLTAYHTCVYCVEARTHTHTHLFDCGLFSQMTNRNFEWK